MIKCLVYQLQPHSDRAITVRTIRPYQGLSARPTARPRPKPRGPLLEILGAIQLGPSFRPDLGGIDCPKPASSRSRSAHFQRHPAQSDAKDFHEIGTIRLRPDDKREQRASERASTGPSPSLARLCIISLFPMCG